MHQCLTEGLLNDCVCSHGDAACASELDFYCVQWWSVRHSGNVWQMQ